MGPFETYANAMMINCPGRMSNRVLSLLLASFANTKPEMTLGYSFIRYSALHIANHRWWQGYF